MILVLMTNSFDHDLSFTRTKTSLRHDLHAYVSLTLISKSSVGLGVEDDTITDLCVRDVIPPVMDWPAPSCHPAPAPLPACC